MSQQTTPSPALAPDYKGSSGKPTKFRWIILAMLFYATTVNYIDRTTLNTLEPSLRDAIGWKPYQYGLINAVFSMFYGIGFLIMGNIIDRLGTRAGFAISVVGWSLAGIATAFTNTPFQFGVTRACLAIFEAGNFPAAVKTVAEWFPQKQRATATGVVNAGSNMGAVFAPIVVTIIIPFAIYRLHMDASQAWRSAFFVTPILALIWVVLWLKLYRNPAVHPKVNAAELDFIESDSLEAKDPTLARGAAKPIPAVKWRNVLPHRQAWAFMLGKFVTDPVWWFFLFWSGAFFYDKFGVKLSGVALPLIYVYLLADVGSIAGGWLSSNLINRGWTPNKARKTAMSVCALFVMPVAIAPLVPPTMAGGIWICATLIGFAAAGHQGFSSNLFSTTSDLFPKRAVSSVNGLGGVAAALGNMTVQSIAGLTLDLTGSYFTLFLFAACAYPVAILLVHACVPRLTPVTEKRLETVAVPRWISAAIFAILGFIVALPLSYVKQNNVDYRVYDRKYVVTQTFNDMVGKLPKDLVKKSEIKNADKEATDTKDPLTVTLTLARDATPAEAVQVEAIKAYPAHALDLAYQHFPKGFNFTQYIAATFAGNIYKSADRDILLPILFGFPLCGLLIGAIIGALLHGFLFSSQKNLDEA